MEIIPVICTFEVGPIGPIYRKNTLTPGVVTIVYKSPFYAVADKYMEIKCNGKINDYLKIITRLNKICVLQVDRDFSCDDDLPANKAETNFVSIKVLPRRCDLIRNCKSI